MLKEDNSFKKRHFSSVISEIETTVIGDSLDTKSRIHKIVADGKTRGSKHVIRNN